MIPAADVTWWTVAVAALAYYALGAAWFTPLFGKAWDRSLGHDRTRSDGRFPTSYYVVPLVSAAAITTLIALLAAAVERSGVDSWLVGAAVGLAVAFAILTNALTPNTPRPYLFAAVTGGYHLTASMAAGLLLGAL